MTSGEGVFGVKIVLAPDSFKGTLSSAEVCRILREAFRCCLPTAELTCLPMADGGEGTLAALVAATGAQRRSVTVLDPLGRPRPADFALLPQGRGAFIEMAEASGLERLRDEERNPMAATTYGTGQLVRAALDAGATDITIGIGGSATVDGGAGLAQALGCRLLDASGQDLPHGGASLRRLARLEVSPCDQRLRKVRLRVACDVTNPLLGPTGAATVFGPQKGASPEDVRQLEEGLRHWAQAVIEAGMAADSDQPGDGAAGGLGFALRTLAGAQMVSGARLVAELAGLKQAIATADLVVTGEGRTDFQTLFGKLPVVVAELSAAADVPCVLISGDIAGDQAPLRQHFAACFSTVPAVLPLAQVLKQARADLFSCGCAVAGLVAAASRRKGGS